MSPVQAKVKINEFDVPHYCESGLAFLHLLFSSSMWVNWNHPGCSSLWEMVRAQILPRASVFLGPLATVRCEMPQYQLPVVSLKLWAAVSHPWNASGGDGRLQIRGWMECAWQKMQTYHGRGVTQMPLSISRSFGSTSLLRRHLSMRLTQFSQNIHSGVGGGGDRCHWFYWETWGTVTTVTTPSPSPCLPWCSHVGFISFTIFLFHFGCAHKRACH